MPLKPDYAPPQVSMASRRQGVENLRAPDMIHEKVVSNGNIANAMEALLDEIEYYQQQRNPTK